MRPLGAAALCVYFCLSRKDFHMQSTSLLMLTYIVHRILRLLNFYHEKHCSTLLLEDTGFFSHSTAGCELCTDGPADKVHKRTEQK